jgi:hypothetical protein
MKRTQTVGWTLGILLAVPFVYRGIDWWGPRGNRVLFYCENWGRGSRL